MMRKIIERKRDGIALAAEEWQALIAGYCAEQIDDAQMAAFLMACLWRGMTFDEAYALTRAMVSSGRTLEFNDDLVVDKHSSGGVSDIVSLAGVPLAAACGLRVAKLSGRALGHTGGTIDKLESIPGVRTALSLDDFMAQVERVGCAIAAQSAELVPADRRLYALRDKTGSVPALGLIAASIVSKKIAGGAHTILFDVKTGHGAFMRTFDDALLLAQTMLAIAGRFGRRVCVLVTSMDESLGRTIGTGIEVVEACELLRGGHADARARTLVVEVVRELLHATGFAGARARIETAIGSGHAYEKFVAMIEAQGGTRRALATMRLDSNPRVVCATQSGYLAGVDVVQLGNLGRALAEQDPLGGLRVCARIGDRIEMGTPLVELHGAGKIEAPEPREAFTIAEAPPEVAPLIYERIASTDSSDLEISRTR